MEKSGRPVRKRTLDTALFGSSGGKKAPKVDRRIEKSKRHLHSALMSLMHELSYDEITIQQILDRADSGRSTFYSHFRDKDHLLVYGVQNLGRQLAGLPVGAVGVESVIGFSEDFFNHADQSRGVYRSLTASSGWKILRPHFQDMFGTLLSPRIKSVSKRKSDIPEALLIHFLGSTLIEVTTWWMEQKDRYSVQEITSIYASFVLPVLKTRIGK